MDGNKWYKRLLRVSQPPGRPLINDDQMSSFCQVWNSPRKKSITLNTQIMPPHLWCTITNTYSGILFTDNLLVWDVIKISVNTTAWHWTKWRSKSYFISQKKNRQYTIREILAHKWLVCCLWSFMYYPGFRAGRYLGRKWLVMLKRNPSPYLMASYTVC